ncbi:bifunctional adenosylcobinamide kinase/adenosylcobinamide-phosphate guanylyltransferase [Salipaludibacillus sp. HK11]|uniref:bifunctional adenosylcobinamide kinase/adenosylcobinamide-phosphate guanylyltransferase n=1 Tax=Salipaludibacillus sp. HK11 TaxID=3394320 RepID=UPI0039FC27EB
MIVFVSGAARSGKSRFAEEKALEIYREQKSATAELVYVATSRKTDHEMIERIRFHQEDRSESWQTIEEPFDLTSVPLKTGMGDVVLVDCLTIWLSNMLYQTDPHSYLFSATMKGESNQSYYLINLIDRFIDLAKVKQQTLIFVTNDLNEGEQTLVDAMVSEYIYVLEKIHQHIVDRADSAVQVIAGIPIDWKGEKSL